MGIMLFSGCQCRNDIALFYIGRRDLQKVIFGCAYVRILIVGIPVRNLVRPHFYDIQMPDNGLFILNKYYGDLHVHIVRALVHLLQFAVRMFFRLQLAYFI